MAQATAKSTERPGEPAKARQDGADARDPALASLDSFKPLKRPPLRLGIGGTVAVAVAVTILAALGYRAYQMLAYSDIPIAKVRVAPAARGEVSTSTREAVEEVGSASRDEPAVQAPVEEPAPKTAVRAATAPRRPIPQAAAVRKASTPEAPCTEAIAAMGLCAPKPAPAAGSPAKNGPARAAPCAAGVSALGLCAAATNQKKE